MAIGQPRTGATARRHRVLFGPTCGRPADITPGDLEATTLERVLLYGRGLRRTNLIKSNSLHYNSQWSLAPKTETGPRSRLNAGLLVSAGRCHTSPLTLTPSDAVQLTSVYTQASSRPSFQARKQDDVLGNCLFPVQSNPDRQPRCPNPGGRAGRRPPT
jgi:hypothetical protein